MVWDELDRIVKENQPTSAQQMWELLQDCWKSIPGRSKPSLRCVLMELNRTPQQDAAQEPSCSCYPVQTFSAGSSCKLLTKNAVFRSPAGEGSTLVCAGDEATNSIMVWDAGSGSLIQKLSADLPVLDICPFEVNQGSYLASLTEKMLKIYKWE
ncbi:unnamed protein product [Oncorhynchus mykiss]|uniref:RING-type E3 ubiquitin transferase n=1 Tax=Oncorhynchus mykiss TaxID=8022 RepID=A0A060WZD9_ONCMY|nr:unnamed protein product [Oncorhynchus mykiss]